MLLLIALKAPASVVTRVGGKPKFMLEHLINCSLSSLDTKQTAETMLLERKKEAAQRVEAQRIVLGSTSGTANQSGEPNPHAKRQRTSSEGSSSTRPIPDKSIQDQFARDIVDLFVAIGLPFHALDSPQLHKFAKTWIPGMQVPSSKVAGGRVLSERVAEVEESIHARVEGKLAMGQCDGWKNISKTPVIAMIMTVEGKVSEYMLILSM